MSGKTILVTGANRGIGLAVMNSLARRSPESTLIMASRDFDAAGKAIEEVKGAGLKAEFHPLALDITKDDSIEAAVLEMEEKFGKLDVLINNAAGVKVLPEDADSAEYRAVWRQVMDLNVASVLLLTRAFLPLLRKSELPRVINVSSVRASFAEVVSGRNPPTSSLAYSVSKTALNMLTVEMANAWKDVEFQNVCPGYCKTSLNGFRGVKDPLDGAIAPVELALAAKGKYAPGFWHCEENGMQQIGW